MKINIRPTIASLLLFILAVYLVTPIVFGAFTGIIWVVSFNMAAGTKPIERK